jgi:hypothetical protein
VVARNELSAKLNDVTVYRARASPSTYLIASFEDSHRLIKGCEPRRGGQSRQSSSDNNNPGHAAVPNTFGGRRAPVLTPERLALVPPPPPAAPPPRSVATKPRP